MANGKTMAFALLAENRYGYQENHTDKLATKSSARTAQIWTENERRMKMYNDNCKTDAPCCDVKVPVDSMKNTIMEIHDHAMKAREMAFDIYKKLFGTMPSDPDNPKIECAFDALIDINRIERGTSEILCAVIQRIGD